MLSYVIIIHFHLLYHCYSTPHHYWNDNVLRSFYIYSQTFLPTIGLMIQIENFSLKLGEILFFAMLP